MRYENALMWAGNRSQQRLQRSEPQLEPGCKISGADAALRRGGEKPKNLTGDRIPVCQTELGSLNTPGKQGKWQHPDYVGELGWKDVQEKLLRQIKVTVLKLTFL
jgi:hypothetical protein